MALDVYLSGKGIAAAAKTVGRGVRATENMLLSDLPRNYRNCITWVVDEQAQSERWKDNKWTQVERKYLVLLRKHKRTVPEMCKLLGRTPFELGQMTAEIEPKRTSPGFGLEKK